MPRENQNDHGENFDGKSRDECVQRQNSETERVKERKRARVDRGAWDVPTVLENMAVRIADASGGDVREKQQEEDRMRDIHIGKRGSEAAGEEQPDKLRKTVRFEQESSSASASSDPTAALEYLASCETQSRLGSVLVQKLGHGDDDVQISALDPSYEMDGRGAVAKSHKGLRGVERGKGISHQWKEQVQCSKGDQCSFRHERDDRAKPTPKAVPPSGPQDSKTRDRGESSKRNARGRSQSEKFNRPQCKYFLRGTCTKSPCEYRHPPESSQCQFCKSESGCKFGKECSLQHWKVEEQPNKKPNKGDDKSAVASVKSVRQLSCVSQDIEPPDSATIF